MRVWHSIVQEKGYIENGNLPPEYHIEVFPTRFTGNEKNFRRNAPNKLPHGKAACLSP
jgi:hypothetical protein